MFSRNTCVRLGFVRNKGYFSARFYPGSVGSGAGKGGGAGGSIRESGGALGRWGAANEEGYFFKKQQEQLEKLKQKMDKEEPKTDKKEP